ncbi:MAG: DUF3486 family protein [Zavarzinia sp.]|nr:DUF3486 family protein [Zavarzinia sp.]
MPPRSSIDQLPPEILAAAERMWASRRFTLSEMVERINAMAPPEPISRSALGRKTRDWDEELREIKAARELARQWKTSVADDPDGDIGSVVGEQLNVMALRTVKALVADSEAVDLKTLANAARVGRDLAVADKVRADRDAQVRSIAAPLEVIDAFARRLTAAVAGAAPELVEALLAVLEPVAEDLAKELG